MKILLTGRSGQLGGELLGDVIRQRQYETLELRRADPAIQSNTSQGRQDRDRHHDSEDSEHIAGHCPAHDVGRQRQHLHGEVE